MTPPDPLTPHDAPPRPNRRLAHLIPDEPGWIDLRGSLLSGRCRIYAGADTARGFVLRSTDYPFAFAWGQPPPQALARAVVGTVRNPDFRLLVAPVHVEGVVEGLPGWRRAQDAILHRWQGGEGDPISPDGAEITILDDGFASEKTAELSARAPEELRSEIELALRRECPMAVAWVVEEEGQRQPVAFCYAPLISETLWDVSVDTLAPYRRRGLAAAGFDALRRHLARQGLTPVWGAHDDNTASLRLAAKLGFVEESRLLTFAPPGH